MWLLESEVKQSVLVLNQIRQINLLSDHRMDNIKSDITDFMNSSVRCSDLPKDKSLRESSHKKLPEGVFYLSVFLLWTACVFLPEAISSLCCRPWLSREKRAAFVRKNKSLQREVGLRRVSHPARGQHLCFYLPLHQMLEESSLKCVRTPREETKSIKSAAVLRRSQLFFSTQTVKTFPQAA